MSRGDPGYALKCTTIEQALELLALPLGDGFAIPPRGSIVPPPGAAEAQAEAADAVEEWATVAGYRARRVILDRDWWKQAGGPMLARVADRRRVARNEAAPVVSPTLAAGTGWVAIVPDNLGGYRMRALYPDDATPIDWPVDAEVAERLSAFAFTFLPRLPRRALGARDILGFAFRHGRGDLALMLALGLGAAVLGLLGPMATGWLIDRAIPAKDAHAVAAVVAALGLAGLALVGLEVLRSIAVMRFEARLGVAMQAALVDRVVTAPAEFFRRFSSGDLALRMGSVNAVQRSMTGSAIGTVGTALFAVASLVLMLSYSAKLTAAAGSLLLAGVTLSVAIGLLRLRVGPRIEALDGRLGAMTFELFAGIAKLRAAAAEPRAWTRWRATYGEFRHANGIAARIENAESLALSLLQPAATVLVLYMAWRLPHDARFTTGDFVAFQTALFGLLGALHSLVSTGLHLVNLKPLWDRARPILETPPEDASARGERHEPLGAIRLEDVGFAYPGGPPVLAGVSLDIAPGEFVAIVGASGSGKSTLLRLLLGFEKPAAGTIRYDGRDLSGLDPRHLRRRLGTVLQGGRLWAGDLLSNIAGASRASVEEVWEAARQAGLAEDIEKMPMGLYTVVGEGLSTLSGGQRQRVLIARALVARPRILLLDEATSALDNVSQARVLAGLGSLPATRVVIAHRLNTVRDADRIVVLERGRVVQQGTFRELAARPGAFAALLARQVA